MTRSLMIVVGALLSYFPNVLPVQDDDIAALVRLLSSKEPVIAAHAEEALLDLGSRAIPHLERAEKDAAPEARERLQRILKDIREFEAGLETFETDKFADLLRKLDDRALVLQKRLSRRTGRPARVAAVLEIEHAGKLGAPDPYLLATYSFEFETRDDVKLVMNDWDFLLTGGRLRVRTVTDDRSGAWDLGETDFDKPAIGNPENWKSSDMAPAGKGRVYAIHTSDSNSDFWTKMQILERRAGQWILFRWEKVSQPGDLLKLERRPERLMKSAARLQIRAGDHVGSDPMRVFLEGGKNAQVEEMSAKPFTLEGGPDPHGGSTGFVDGGLIPLGKVWILRRAQIKAMIHEKGHFKLSAKGQILASVTRKTGHDAETLDETWKGRLVIRPGEERTVFAEISWAGRFDVTLSGSLWDDRFADMETFPELAGAEKEKADALVRDLGSGNPDSRERAIQELVEWGPAVLGHLRAVDLSNRSLTFQVRLKDVIRRIWGE